MIFNAAGGGGNPLNFNVVGNPQPTNPKPNTIWVNTDVKITGYYFSATKPENMQSGEVWFRTGTISPVDFNAVKKNGIQVYPLYAQQYINGQFQTVEAKSYQNGEWVDWIDYIYNRGQTKYTFASSAKKNSSSSSMTAIAPTITQHDDCVEFSLTHATSGAKGRVGFVYITEPINLTDVKTLVFEGDFYQNYNATYPKIRVYSSIGTYMDDNVVAEMTNVVDKVDVVYTKSVELDVSGLSNDHYIGFTMLSESGSSSATAYIKLREIYKK